jgi:hypothetical protein
MPQVTKTGLYRNEQGLGIKLVSGAVVSDAIAATYQLDADPVSGEIGAEPDSDLEVPANPTDDFEETPFGERQEGSPESGEVVRDGVLSDGEGGEVPVASGEVAERDAQPVENVDPDVQTEIRMVTPAVENRMAPAPAENRQSKNSTKKRKSSDATDAQLAQDVTESGGEKSPADENGDIPGAADNS